MDYGHTTHASQLGTRYNKAQKDLQELVPSTQTQCIALGAVIEQQTDKPNKDNNKTFTIAHFSCCWTNQMRNNTQQLR